MLWLKTTQPTRPQMDERQINKRKTNGTKYMLSHEYLWLTCDTLPDYGIYWRRISIRLKPMKNGASLPSLRPLVAATSIDVFWKRDDISRQYFTILFSSEGDNECKWRSPIRSHKYQKSCKIINNIKEIFIFQVSFGLTVCGNCNKSYSVRPITYHLQIRFILCTPLFAPQW